MTEFDPIIILGFYYKSKFKLLDLFFEIVNKFRNGANIILKPQYDFVHIAITGLYLTNKKHVYEHQVSLAYHQRGLHHRLKCEKSV